MMFMTTLARNQSSKGRRKDGRLYEGLETHDSEVKMGVVHYEG